MCTRLHYARRLRLVASALAATMFFAVPSGALAAPTITEFASGNAPGDIVAGPDGNLWFVEGSAIGRVTPAGTVTEFSSGLTGSGLSGIAVGPDGNLWFAESGNDRIGRITTGATPVITEFWMGISNNSSPQDIAAGPDGNLWFTEPGTDQIGRITPAGVVDEFPIPGSNNIPLAITAGPDGNLWFTEYTAPGGIGRITTGASPVITEFGPATSYPRGIVAGPDGNMWFAGYANPGGIGRITTAGAILTPFTTGLTPNGGPLDITAGGDGNSTSRKAQAAVRSGDHTVRCRHGVHDGPEQLPVRDHRRQRRQHLVHRTQRGPRGTPHRRAQRRDRSSGRHPLRRCDPRRLRHRPLPADDVSLRLGSDERLRREHGGDLRRQRGIAGSRHLGGRGARAIDRVSLQNRGDQRGGNDRRSGWHVHDRDGAGRGATRPPACHTADFGRSATISTVSGAVVVKLPGGTDYLPLSPASTVPVGTTIDASGGKVRLTNVRDRSGKLQTGTFWGGSFVVRQARGKRAPTVLTLTAPMRCARSARHLSSVNPKKGRVRELWGRDNHGRFETHGRSAVATVRGTAWLMRDTCAGTLVKVTRGAVSVRDLVKHRTVVVLAGRSYVARLR